MATEAYHLRYTRHRRSALVMNQMHSSIVAAGLIALLLHTWSCQSPTSHLYQNVSPDHSNVHFENTLHLTDTFNILHYMYFFNGGGVAAGDLNQDGLIDLFFCGNQVPSRLYLNQGNLVFKDVTDESGISVDNWASGASLVDINADGWLDIYVSMTGLPQGKHRANKLLINQQDGTFQEQAAQYGLADTSYNSQAVFFDFDRDGDLDVYLLRHDHQFLGANAPLPKKRSGEAKNTDALFKNLFMESGQLRFIDYSQSAGILQEGFGLGVSMSDFNQDGWPDIYIANDFISNDLLYINNQNGTFTNRIDQYTRHQSHNGMGCDVADLNNDGWPDIFVADMLPITHEREKVMAMNSNEQIFLISQQLGYQAQYTRNTLQLNRGPHPSDSSAWLFSEIGQLAGVQRTDWSWTGWLADVDNNGFKDLFITNGYFRDLTNMDFISYRKKRSRFTSQQAQDNLYTTLLQDLPTVSLPNHLYLNQGALDFKKQKNIFPKSMSNGAILIDLDNDGDLDLVTNELDATAQLYENKIEEHGENDSNYLNISLRGLGKNLLALGAKVAIYVDQEMQVLENYPVHGFYSSVSGPLHFGLGSKTKVDSIQIIWTDQTVTTIRQVAANQTLTVEQKNSSVERITFLNAATPLLRTVMIDSIIHRENNFQTFLINRLAFRDRSRLGPAISIGDVNGDLQDDLFIGGAHQSDPQLYIQQNGKFMPQAFPGDANYEDVASTFFDADGDGDLDLYVVSGGSVFRNQSQYYRDRLYRNKGSGIFERDTLALPAKVSSGSCVSPSDFDGDGDIDLFVGGRHVPGGYPSIPRSYLLENRGGQFYDVAERWSADLEYPGMVTDAMWTDYNSDGKTDLMLVGEWMPLTVFKNNGTSFSLVQNEIDGLPDSRGWWHSLAAGDIDNDGDVDYILGNEGLNTGLNYSNTEPLELIAFNPKNNEEGEYLLAHYLPSEKGGEKLFAKAGRDQMLAQLPAMQQNFPSYQSYAEADVNNFPGKPQTIHSAHTLVSGCLINHGSAGFEWRPLPQEAQFSSIAGLQLLDIDGDDFLDLVAVGNHDDYQVSIGRQDAGYGLVALGDGQGNFSALTIEESGLFAGGNQRAIKRLEFNGKTCLLSAENNGIVRAWEIRDSSSSGVSPW